MKEEIYNRSDIQMEEIILMTEENIGECQNIYAQAFDVMCITGDFSSYSETNRELIELCAKAYNFPRYFKQCINHNDKYAYCIKADGRIIGFITAWNIPSTIYPYSVYIDILAVLPEYQKKGYGTKLLKYLLEEVIGEVSACLVTKTDSPAYKMYGKIGFLNEASTRMTHSPIFTNSTTTELADSVSKLLEEQNQLLKEKELLLQQVRDISQLIKEKGKSE